MTGVQTCALPILFVFFFFKQKTAYEILTCDWSSDVCSSDLYSEKGGSNVFSVQELNVPKVPYLEMGGSNVFLFEIGRASCRERV